MENDPEVNDGVAVDPGEQWVPGSGQVVGSGEWAHLEARELYQREREAQVVPVDVRRMSRATLEILQIRRKESGALHESIAKPLINLGKMQSFGVSGRVP